MFKQFLNSLKRPNNAPLIEAIQQGYHACFEAYYHGTADHFDKFDLDKYQTVKNGDWGKGIYFDSSKSGADYYRREALRSKSKEYQNAYNKYIETENTEDLKQFRDVGNKIDQSNEGNIVEVSINPNAKIMKYNAQGITDPYLTDRAKEKGFDAVLVDEGKGTEELVVINTDIIIYNKPLNEAISDPKDHNFIKPYSFRNNEDYHIAWVNTEKFDNLWKHNEMNVTSKNAIHNRYEQFKDYWLNNKDIEVSTAFIGRIPKTNEEIVSIGDGRHRYAFMKDIGMKSIPMLLSNNSLQYAKENGFITNTLTEAINPNIKVTFGKEPRGQTFDQATAYLNGTNVARLIYELDFPVNGQINIELIETKPQYRKLGIAGALIQKLKEKYPDYKVSGRSTNIPAENLLKKHKVIDRTVLERNV